ncbi:hypothetical protein ACI2K6_16275 [Microbacterium sp. NPDC006705]|uniref:hypothetical protein n=1 Tax=Microbacterium TaxID=33882 RepID=UPI0022AFF4A2|nr:MULTISPECIES: hypothetical protein [Microbacterium]MCZ4069085.1 hypothetical protein [Microbacterium sp. H37-C3]WHE37873.1 hypothetical protein P6897_16265 [Microbacterium sp. BDGP8]WRK17160.1 hypothetical protein VC184_14830 [Microbacterium plantarum]
MHRIDLWGDFTDGVSGAVDAVGGVVNFWSDPFGNMYKSGRDATISLSRDVIPAITESTLPDLTLQSFLSTYAVSFALALMLAVLLLFPQFVRVAKGDQSGQELFEAIGLYFPGFIMGAMFGPLIGLSIIELLRLLTRSIIDWAYGGSIEQMVETFSTIAPDDPAKMTGAAVVGMIVIWAMTLGMLIIPFIFIFQLVVQYFTGALIPIAIAWMVDPRRRAAASRAVGLWVGMLLVQPLLFLALGFAFRLPIDSVAAWGNDGFKNLARVIIAVMAIVLAVFLPFVLITWARKSIAAAPTSDSTPTTPIGPTSPGRSHRAPSREAPAAPTRQTVRTSARPSDAAGSIAPKLGAQNAGKVRAKQPTGAGTPALASAGTKASTAFNAGTAVAAKGAQTVARKASETAHESVTPPPVQGKERPQ